MSLVDKIDNNRRTSAVLVLALFALLVVAALGGRNELDQCETALRAELGEDAPYFRTGYRMRQEWDGTRVFYLVFFRPVHGLADCRFEIVDGHYRLATLGVQLTLPGGAPAPVP